MVCKEDVLSWFKDSESYKRVDVLYELLNMCLPFEVRFLASCVEEVGKQTYLELHGPTLNANDLEKLSKDPALSQGLLNNTVRHKVILYLSLLSSRNYSVANWLYKNTLRTDWIEEYIVKGNVKDDNLQSEFLLLFVMALRHPAFRFEQKRFFAKILDQLVETREARSRASPKTSIFGYPPGLGYPPNKPPVNSLPEIPIIPVKTSLTIPCGDDTLHQQHPGLHMIPHPPHELLAWNRPGISCGAPDVRNIPPPFPQSTVSPLVSQSASPIHSRSNSPHLPPPTGMRFGPMLPQHPPPPPNIPMEQPMPPIATHMPPPPIDLLSNEYQHYRPDPRLQQQQQPGNKLPEEELNSIPEDKRSTDCWLAKEQKPMNGMRMHNMPPPPGKGCRPPFLVDHFQELSLDGRVEGSLHKSNSSSNSSLNQSPPETPALSAMQPPCPKARVNGMPAFATGPPPVLPPPFADATSSPPPQPFNNCSVPYTTYPTSFSAIPARSIFPYTQSFSRPPFSAPFPAPYQANESCFQTYALPFMSMVYSSPQFPARSPNCYNCGAVGHAGQDCTSHNIEDVTQMTTYTLEYAAPPPLPDADK